MHYSNSLNQAMLDLIETNIGANPRLKLYGATMPPDINTGIVGQLLLADLAIPGGTDWLLAATAARPSVVAKQAATWSVTGAAAAGAGVLCTFFRLTSSGGVAGIQGTVGVGTGELQLDNATIAQNQVVTITSFAITSANIT